MTAGASVELDLQLAEQFLQDAGPHTVLLVQVLSAAASGTPPSADELASVRLAAQAIKRAANVVSLRAVGQLAEALELRLSHAEAGALQLTEHVAGAWLPAARSLEALIRCPPQELCVGSGARELRAQQALEALDASSAWGAPRSADARTVTAPEAQAALDAGAAMDVRSEDFLFFGPSAPSSLAPADPEILKMFATEAENCLATLAHGLVELESSGGAGAEDLMRAAHSIKGAAATVGLGAAAELAHAMEDCLVASQAGTIVLSSLHIDVLLDAVDLLSEIARASAAGPSALQQDRSHSARELAQTLQKLASGQAAVRGPNTTSPALDSDGAVSNGNVPREDVARKAAGAATGTRGSSPTPRRRSLSSPPKAAQASPYDSRSAEGVVRVSAQSINRLMGLAGESLIESRRVQAMSAGMQRLKRRQSTLLDVCHALQRELVDLQKPTVQALLVEVGQHIVEQQSGIVEQIAELERYAQRVDDLSERLYREALKSRMRPFGDSLHGFPRVVRDLARQLGKQVALQISGEGTDVDRDVLESLESPLNHLLRNALDHGIEAPEERVRAGKAPQGTLRLEARHHAGTLSVTVSDDGRGIDPERLRREIVARGLVTVDIAAALSTAELLEFIFLPGFSTAASVTQISGRGVGLDAVRNAVHAVSGVVEVRSEVGLGTAFHLKLPVTRSVIRAVVAELAKEAYAFPLLGIERILRLEQRLVRTVGRATYFALDGANIALVSARKLLGLGQEPASVDELCVVVVRDGESRYGVTVDELLGEHDLVVRPLDERLGKVQNIAAASILRSGATALILDVPDLVRSIDKTAGEGQIEHIAAPLAAVVDRRRKRILVVDDSITVREAERQMLLSRGYQVDVAVDGMDGWNSVRNEHYDLVVSDVDMPRLNGIEFVRTIRQDARYSAMPIVIVSYKDREEDRLRGLDAGANYYLMKSSFHEQALVTAVENLIGGPEV